ncbi:MAG: hypothetical protein E4H14_15515, partial [Candidatus Thorarchaeota archaeon]
MREIDEFPDDDESDLENLGTKVKDYEKRSLTTEERDEIIRKFNDAHSISRSSRTADPSKTKSDPLEIDEWVQPAFNQLLESYKNTHLLRKHASMLIRESLKANMVDVRKRFPEVMQSLDEYSVSSNIELVDSLGESHTPNVLEAMTSKIRETKVGLFWTKIIAEGHIDDGLLLHISPMITNWQKENLHQIDKISGIFSSYLSSVMKMLDGVTFSYIDRIMRYSEKAESGSEVMGWFPARNMRYMAVDFLLGIAGCVYSSVTGHESNSVGQSLLVIRNAFLTGGHEEVVKVLERKKFSELYNAICAAGVETRAGNIRDETHSLISCSDDEQLEKFSELPLQLSRKLLQKTLVGDLWKPNPFWVALDSNAIIDEKGPDLSESEIDSMKQNWVSELRPLLSRAHVLANGQECTWQVLLSLGAYPVIWVVYPTGVVEVVSNERGAGKGRGTFSPYPNAKVMSWPLLIESKHRDGNTEFVSCRSMSSQLWDHLKWTITEQKTGSETKRSLSAQNAWHCLLNNLWDAESSGFQIHCNFPIQEGSELSGKHLIMAQRMALWLEPGIKGTAQKLKQGRLPSLSPTIRALNSQEDVVRTRVQRKLVERGCGWQELTKKEMALKTDQGKVYWDTPNLSIQFGPAVRDPNSDFSTSLRGLIGAWMLFGNISRKNSLIPWTLERIAKRIDVSTQKPIDPHRTPLGSTIQELGWVSPYTEYSGSVNLDEFPENNTRRVIHSTIRYWVCEVALIASGLVAELPSWNLSQRMIDVLPDSNLRNLTPKGECDNMIGLFIELRDRLEHLGFSERSKVAAGIKKGLGGEKIAAGS